MKIEDIIGKDICVKCSTEQEFKSFLKAAEKAGMTWAFGDRPTQHFEYWNNKPIYIECFEGNDKHSNFISCYSCGVCDTTINFSDLDFSDNYKEKYQLEIKQEIRLVLATLYNSKGTIVNYAAAVCSPEDKFDYETSKKIALQRLFDIEPEKETEFEKEKPYHKIGLKAGSLFLGFVGDSTEAEAFGHIKLYVGDVVELFNSEGKSLGLRCVCKNEICSTGYIMGVGGVKDFVNGQGTDNCDYSWLIIKRKSYTEMIVGDTVDVVEYRAI